MSEAPTPSSSSPQKRPISESTDTQIQKKQKIGETPTADDILNDDFDINSIHIPGEDISNNNKDINTNNNSASPAPRFDSISSLNLPLQTSSQASNNSTGVSTPNQTLSELGIPSSAPADNNSNDSANFGLHLPTGGNNSSTATPAPTTGANIDDTTVVNTADTGGPTQGSKQAPADPDKLSDALLAAGVDLKSEEALLNTALPIRSNQDETAQEPIILNTPFLDPNQVVVIMNKIIATHGLKANVQNDPAILQLMTYATEDWMKNTLTNAVILSRHRRRSIKNRKRSEISKSLRDLSIQQKQQEDKRQERKKNSGIDKPEEKEATEEIQHKATNATVAMMTGKKKKYSWMTGGSMGAGGSKPQADGGIRFREAREEPGIVVRDLLNSLEKKRMGVEKTITKGYAKLKD